MTRPKILVTGSTGKTGFPTVAELCRLGHEVRAVVHREDDRSAALRQLGAEIVLADLYDSKQMALAMAGVSAASFCPPVQPYMIEAANVFAVAAHDAGVQHIVQMSQWLAHPRHPSIHSRQLWLVEEILRMLPGSTYTLINPGVFADPILQLLPAAIHFGMMPNIFVGLINPPASNEDMGRCVAHALAKPELHAGIRYRPTGPDLLSMQEIADTFSRVLSRSVKLRDMPAEAFLKAGRAAGSPDVEVSNVYHYIQESPLHVFDTHGPTADVQSLTGRLPEDFETITRRYAAMPYARNTFSNKLKAFASMAKLVVTPSLDLARHETAMEYPTPRTPEQSGASRIWHQQHDDNEGKYRFRETTTP